MPCHTYVCEWCHNEFRRDRIADHVKSKHFADIAKKWMEDYAEQTNKEMSIIRRIFMSRDPKTLAVESALHEGGDFFFGVNPMFFPEDDDDARIKYKASAMNMESHKESLMEILSLISLKDALDVGMDVSVRHPEMVSIKQQLSLKNKEHASLVEECGKMEAQIEAMRVEIKDYREMLEVPYAIGLLKEELSSAKRLAHYGRKEASELDSQFKKYRESTEKNMKEMMEADRKEKNTLEEELSTLRSAHAELESKIRMKINDGVAKEMEKLRKKEENEEEKKIKKAEKEIEKEKKKAEKKKEKKKEKKIMKVVAMLMKKKSGSDSDSDSDEDSSDEDLD